MMRKKIIYTLWVLLVLGIIATAVTFTAIWNGWIGYMPDMEALQNPIDKYASQIISESTNMLLRLLVKTARRSAPGAAVVTIVFKHTTRTFRLM